MKEDCLSLCFGLSFVHIQWPADLLSRNIGCGFHLGTIPLPFFGSPVSPRNEVIHLTGAPIFVTSAPGAPPDCLDVVASMAYSCSLTLLRAAALASGF